MLKQREKYRKAQSKQKESIITFRSGHGAGETQVGISPTDVEHRNSCKFLFKIFFFPMTLTGKELELIYTFFSYDKNDRCTYYSIYV